ncbi:MAG: serine--tRNA ligase [Candidatus Omnitrophica bacterium]|nr:serine--tRNA ligase [Candidatus Omnitrophota bacterium]MCF7892037.1 serine--tRNA ligase [Candidatus Omnitrophota bacterium]MCF7896182.1 serine--tRNA ligase [Candidatus Omnitrophota bacterium]MCF7897703.1 serine--tRNA ligase [Candidatus Omnitrophota bacterium]MCF7909540.1 serine--tRNA ligase [Candidatus Omnitrophota bacterium]
MLDIKFIRENPQIVKESLKKRNSKFNLDDFLKLDKERRRLLAKIENISAEQNKISSKIKKLFKDKKEPKEAINRSKKIKVEIELLKNEFKNIDKRWREKTLQIPNIPDSSLPEGGALANKVIKEAGKKPTFKFSPADHCEIAKRLEIIDFKRATKITGSNFVCFKGFGAQLVRALLNFMLDVHTQKNSYLEIWPPKIVNQSSMQTTGQLPNLKEDMYQIQDTDFFLIPTAEVPVTNLHSNELLEEKSLPISYAAYTPCFRKEAGSYGKDTKGLMRVHEFDKVELVKITKPENSYQALDKILSDACQILDLLKLPYRILLLATGDISFASAKCYDIELYAPGLDKWLEVSSCSNFESFQARRGNIKYKDSKTGKNEYVHTLNGSGVALARLIVAILENYQQGDGSIVIPKVLRSYLGGRKRIKK